MDRSEDGTMDELDAAEAVIAENGGVPSLVRSLNLLRKSFLSALSLPGAYTHVIPPSDPYRPWFVIESDPMSDEDSIGSKLDKAERDTKGNLRWIRSDGKRS